ncbi:MAG: LexA family protein [Methylobacter sp.]
MEPWLTDNLPLAFWRPAPIKRQVMLPLFLDKVPAGFPSPADDFIEKTLDLNELLVQKPAATYFARAQGNSMIDAGIHDNDILIVDRSIEAVTGRIVVCAVNGELTVKRLTKKGEQWFLKAENKDYSDIPIHSELDAVIWGVVTNVIHPL